MTRGFTPEQVAHWEMMLARLKREIRIGPAPSDHARELAATTIAPAFWHHLDVFTYSDGRVDWMAGQFNPERYFAAWRQRRRSKRRK